MVQEALTNGRIGVKVTGNMSASIAKRWAAGVRVRQENCEEYDTGSSVLFCVATEMTNPCGEFSFSVVEHVIPANDEADRGSPTFADAFD